ncbi:MAG: zf-HC2 domain-containing protein [Acidobacteriota bacterium]|nr:zf-HC2 domain-containing protein [Acidobacteriota bacterium]MDQ2841709.1 zf-HC2 domain-containing protein [Acidobacteriota bacterium]
MTVHEHLDNGLLIRFLDGELSDSDFFAVRSHLVSCAACRLRRDNFASLTQQVESFVRATPLGDGQEGRSELAKSLAAVRGPELKRKSSFGTPYFRWGMGLVAAVLIGLLFAPRLYRSGHDTASTEAQVRTNSISVNGESFLVLPYSNPDLPMTAPRIVEMQVPVSALATQGIIFDPAASGSSDRTVLANVLLGLDGQPLGVHVLSSE